MPTNNGQMEDLRKDMRVMEFCEEVNYRMMVGSQWCNGQASPADSAIRIVESAS